jgi:hypothetical protein
MTTRADSFLAEIDEQKTPELPTRSLNTMGDAIALSSPSGSMSKRARDAANKRLSTSLFGERGLSKPGLPTQPTEVESMLQQAKQLRELAARGMKPRAYVKEAERLEAEAKKLTKG